MKTVSELRPFGTRLEVVHLPAARIIGLEARSGGALGNTAPALWNQVLSTGVADALRRLPLLVPGSLFGWTCEYDAPTDTFIYLVCALTPANAPVPEGFSHRDIPETDCVLGLFGEDIPQTLERAKQHGRVPNWEPWGWNAELYFDREMERPPEGIETPWHWLVPVK